MYETINKRKIKLQQKKTNLDCKILTLHREHTQVTAKHEATDRKVGFN